LALVAAILLIECLYWLHDAKWPYWTLRDAVTHFSAVPRQVSSWIEINHLADYGLRVPLPLAILAAGFLISFSIFYLVRLVVQRL